MAIVGRRQFSHPALGAAGGSALHAAIELIYTTISNDLGGRFYAQAAAANGAVFDFDHNFGVDSADIETIIYTGAHPTLTRVSDLATAGWTVIPTPSFEKTKTRVTAPGSGGPHTFLAWIRQNSSRAVQAISASASIVPTGQGEHLVLATTGGSDRTATLPAVSGNAGRKITFVKVDDGVGKLIIDGNGAETINGATTTEITLQYGFIQLLCTGSSWVIVA